MERQIIQKLADIQSLYLQGIHEEFTTLWDTKEDSHTMTFPSVPIVEEIYEEEEVPNV